MKISSKDLIDLIQHPIFVLEVDGKGIPRYADMNQLACSRLKKTKDEIIGLTAKELYGGRLGGVAFEHHCKAARTGQPDDYEIALPFADKHCLVRTSLRPHHDEQGKLLYLIGSSSDVTDSHLIGALDADMQTMTHELEEFVNLAAHDIRSPVRIVKQIAEMLREDFQDLGDGKLELIDMLEDVGEKALSMVTDVLSGAQAAELAANNSTFELGQLLEDIATMLDPFSNSTFIYPDLTIEGDRTATHMILRNLIDNSIKYAQKSAERPLQMEFSIRNTTKGCYEITVEDNGVGFSDPAMLFLETGKLRHETGYGLVGVKRLIRSRGGYIKAENRTEGLGARVIFALPGSARPCPSDADAICSPIVSEARFDPARATLSQDL